MNDPGAQMTYQMGKNALDAGQQYMEQNVCGEGSKCHLATISELELTDYFRIEDSQICQILRLKTLLQCFQLIRRQ